jgi:hypothetical protein
MKVRLIEGDTVNYFQSGKLIGVGQIVDVGEKNGQKVYDVDMLNGGASHWGYRDQFEKIHPVK